MLAPIRDKMERALRNGERLHLEADQVRALVRTPIWALLADLTAKELAELWENEQPEPARPPATITPPASNLGTIGFTTEPSAKNGASPGTTMPEAEQAVGLAASRLASEAVIQVTRRKRHRTPSQSTT